MADRVIREAYAARCRRILAAQKVGCVRFYGVAPKGRARNPRSTVSFISFLAMLGTFITSSAVYKK